MRSSPALRRRRVLLVGDLPPPAHGQSLCFELLCRELPGRGIDCRIVNLARKSGHPGLGVSARRCWEMLGVLVRYLAALATGRRVVYLLIAQSRAGFVRDMLMIWCAWLCRRRIVAHLHGGNYHGFYAAQSWPWRFLIRSTLRRVRRIIVLSERLRGMYAFDPQLADRLVVVMNSPSVRVAGFPRRQGRPARLLFLSQMKQSKGYDDVLRAVAVLKFRNVSVEAAFAGRFGASADDAIAMSSAEAEARFHRRVRDWNLAGVVRYLGPVAGESKWQLLRASDFLVLPTNYRHEGQPIAILEAMAHGCVVVATNFRAIPDMVVDGETGVLVDYRQPHRIADAVERLVADPTAYARMSAAAVARYRSMFTLDHHLDAMESVLREA